MFRIGQKVQCWRTYGFQTDHHPKIGEAFTVARFGWGINRTTSALMSGIGFEEIPGLWDPSCFRPIVERKTDISVFTEMLNPSPVTIDAFNIADHAREIVG